MFQSHERGMSHRLNIVLEDEVWESLQAVPKGERSKVINQALANWILQSRRRLAIEKMDNLRKKARPLPGSTEEWVRDDRDRHR
jgi:hypothetical protein